MSTKPYHPDHLVLSMAVLLLNDAPHQRDLYADYRRPAERIHTYIQVPPGTRIEGYRNVDQSPDFQLAS